MGGIFIFLNLFMPFQSVANITYKGEIPVTSSSSDAVQLYIQGREAFEMGRIVDANVLIDKALLKDPYFASAFLIKAFASNSEEELQKNIGLAKKNSNHVSEAEKILIEMELASLKGDCAIRFELAQKLAGMYPECPRALILLSNEYRNKNDIVKTRDFASRAIVAAPESPIGYRTLALSYLLNEPVDFELAIKYMQKFAELKPGEAIAFIELGDAFRANLDLEDAKMAYTKAVMLDPESYVAFSKRGYINTFLGIFDNAREDFSVARTLYGKNQKLNRPRAGLSDFLANNNKKAIGPAVEVSNNSKSSRYQLGGPKTDQYFCCTLIGMIHGSYSLQGQAINCCEGIANNLSFESIPPDQEMLEANLTFTEAIRAMNSGDYAQAEKKAIEHARQVDTHRNLKKCEVYDYLMGNIHLKQHNYSKAVGFLEKAATVNPYAKYDLGLAYMGLGEWEKSLTVFREVLQCPRSSVYQPDFIRNAEKWEKKLDAVVAESR